MTSHQVNTNIVEDSGTVRPDRRLAIGSRTSSMSAVPDREEAFVTGALQVSEDSISFHTTSKCLNEKDPHESNFRRSSLEDLEIALFVAHARLPEFGDAISTPLPDSVNEESRSLQEHDVSAVKSYASVIETLSLHLPHLKNVQKSSRRENISVSCYDYATDCLASVEDFTVDSEPHELRNSEGMLLRQYLGGVPSNNIHFRLIVANGLSTSLIECLGSSFSMSPEVYEEHLVNSGWLNGKYHDQEPDTWITRDMKKSHMSIRWYRPVKRILQRPYSAADRQSFFATRTQAFSWTEAVPIGLSKPHGVKHVSKLASNILRRDWDIKTDAEATLAMGDFAAWEERATVWSKQCEGYTVGVLLLDPLPIVEDEMTGAAEALRRLGVDHTEPPPKLQVVKKTPAENTVSISAASHLPSRGLVKSSTFVRPRPRADQNFSILSLGGLMLKRLLRPQEPSRDPGPSTEGPETSQAAEDPESGQTGRGNQQRDARITRTRAGNGVPKILKWLVGRSEKKTQKVDQAQELDVLEEQEGTEIKTLEPMNRCMFEGLYPRGPAVDYDLLMDPNNVDLLAKHLDRTKPTAANLSEYLTYNNGRRPSMAEPTIHLEYLFAIIQKDTMNTLRHMDLSLQDIGQHILDDTLIQQRLIHWRLLLEQFGTELQLLEDSLRRFAEFITISKQPHQNDVEDPERHFSPVEKLLGDCVSQINSLRQRTTRSHKSLMANMSIVESKRGIAEAESVTKLTELAFFFIPLTFSASIFSMQVKELNSSQISIAAFFILAVIITAGSYALRLLIRSENFVDQRRKLLSDIRHEARLASSSSIPTKTFLAWLWRRIGLLTVMVTLLVALMVTPIAVLWTRDMNHGFKVLLTILLLVFILAASYVTGNAMLYIDARGLHLRRDIFKASANFKERSYQSPLNLSETLALLFSWLSNRWFLLGLAVTGVGAGPSAALWTSQLTTGIKVGVTVVILFLYVGTVVTILLYVMSGHISGRNRSLDSEEEDI